MRPRRTGLVLAVLALAGGLGGSASAGALGAGPPAGGGPAANPLLAGPGPDPTVATRESSPIPPIRHVFIIMLENKSFDETFGHRSLAHYLAWTLPGMGAFVPNYYGVTHESNPNYVALISGQGANPQSQSDCQDYSLMVPGVMGPSGQALGDGCVFPPAVKTVADQLTARHLTWKGYMEDMGNAKGEAKSCAHPALNSKDNTQSARKGDQYAVRHNPFVYFRSITGSPYCAKDDVPLTRLPGDLRSASRTANYSMIVPNLCHDGHDSPCKDGKPGGLISSNKFLKAWVPRILASPAYHHGGLLIVTFDENNQSDSDASACCNEPQFPNTPNNGGPYPGRGGGRVGAVMLSPYIDPGTLDLASYNHFSLLRSVENFFGLKHLGYAGQAGLRALGPDLFTCYRPGHPRPRHGRLARGSEIKLVQIGQGTAHRPMVEAKLWFPGRLRVGIVVKRHARSTRVRWLGGARRLSACQLARIRLPHQHGRAVVSARAFGGVERRTISF